MSESLDKLQNRILSDAKLKADDIIREAQTKAEQILSEARQKAEKESDEIAAKSRLEAEAIRRSILSSKVRANRLKILDEKNRIVQDIVKTVEERLSSIAESKNFDETAERFVSQAVKAVDSNQPVIRLGFKDATKKHLDAVSKSAPKGSKVVFEDEPIDELGGVIASDEEGRVIFNNSFRSRLERLDSQLLAMISSTIFGE
ncbi:V-type ATP synthase subunit E [Candidatus Bathyarchaeota archaeon]|nr:V-type ATP synthase subunit E [Candidatus Bathyarchaeota archaeon]